MTKDRSIHPLRAFSIARPPCLRSSSSICTVLQLATAAGAVVGAAAPGGGGGGGREEGRQRGERGGRDPPDGAAPEHAPPLVERVLRLGQVPGAAHRGRRVLQVRERPRLAGEEVGQAPPASCPSASGD